ncbi:splicing factor-like protein 1 [Neltuma alba]|uniref:splicing factor-like protein 1 n=1 Tax=Neltuma alba TaxID=207710 RepID=UPI0010A4B4E7|nr:splicing factor-like protein 1 [Prosopis alba]
MENETGAKIHIRGKGCSKTTNISTSSKEDLHVYIEADNKSSLDGAVSMVEKLLIPVEGRNEHKEAQLKELAMLKGTARDENMCYVCGDEGHLSYACPDLQSTFKVNSCYTCFSASPLDVLSPQNDSVQGSGFGFSFGSTQSRQRRYGKKSLMNNVYVGNLPQAFDDNRLSELFSPFGKILEVKAIKDRTTGICRGFGFVEFDSAADAQVAVTHMNGFKMDGRVLKVRIARLLSNAEVSSLNLFPQRSGSAGTSQSVRSQTDRSGPSHFMLPEHPTSLHNSSGMNLFSSTLNSQHCDLKKDRSLSPLSYYSSPSDFSNSGKMHFSCNFSDQSVSLSGGSIPQSPGSQHRSYFVTPPPDRAALPSLDHRLEDANSFTSSLQRWYYRALH